MENSLKKLLLLLFFLSSATFGAVPKPQNLRATLNLQKKELKVITKEIYSLEKSLGKGNKKYLKTLQEKETIEDTIFSLQKKLKENEELAIERASELFETMCVGLSESKTPVRRVSRHISGLSEGEAPVRRVSRRTSYVGDEASPSTTYTPHE